MELVLAKLGDKVGEPNLNSFHPAVCMLKQCIN